MNAMLLIALAVAPGLAIMIYVFYMDKFEKEPLHLLAKTFFLGVLCTLPAVFLGQMMQNVAPTFYSFMGKPAFDAFVLAGLIEEYCKFAVLFFFAYPKRDFNEPYDGITYSVMAAMGFATFENVLYVFYQGGLSVALMRMLTAVPAHATFGILMGYFVGLAKFRPASRWKLLMAGFLVAAGFHGAYDYFLMQNNYQLLALGALISLLVGIWLSYKAIRIHNDNSPHRPGVPPPDTWV